MPDTWITDASPLIALAKVGRAQLLEDLSDELLVPEAVASEVLEGPAADPGRLLLEAGFGRRIAPRELSSRVLAWGLGRGESEVLALGLEIPDATVVVDDAAARRCAAALNLPMIGTLGIVLRAKRLGWIESASALLQSLRDVGFRVDDTTARTVLDSIGEER